MLKSFFFFFTSEELFVHQGQVHGTLEKLNSQPDRLQHSGGGSVCYKTFRCVCRGWLKLSLLLCFAELLSFTLLLLLFLLPSPLDATAHSELWNWRDFFLFSFFTCVLQKRAIGGSRQKGPLISCLHITAEGWVPSCLGRMIKSYLCQMITAEVLRVQLRSMRGGLLRSQHCLIKTQSNEILPQ